MAVRQTITLQSEDGVFKVGELESLIGSAHDAGSGVHQPVSVKRSQGEFRLSITLGEGADETPAEEE